MLQVLAAVNIAFLLQNQTQQDGACYTPSNLAYFRKRFLQQHFGFKLPPFASLPPLPRSFIPYLLGKGSKQQPAENGWSSAV